MINVNKQTEKELSEEEKQKQMMTFIEKYEKEMKQFGMLNDYGARYIEHCPLCPVQYCSFRYHTSLY